MLLPLERMMWVDEVPEENPNQLGGYAGGGSFWGRKYHFDYVSEVPLTSNIVRKYLSGFPITSSIEKSFLDSIRISSSIQYPFLSSIGISSTIEKEYIQISPIDSSGIGALLDMIHHIDRINSTRSITGIKSGLSIDDIRRIFSVKTIDDIENVKKPDSIGIIGSRASLTSIRRLPYAN